LAALLGQVPLVADKLPLLTSVDFSNNHFSGKKITTREENCNNNIFFTSGDLPTTVKEYRQLSGGKGSEEIMDGFP
jgi:hypothetical protein